MFIQLYLLDRKIKKIKQERSTSINNIFLLQIHSNEPTIEESLMKKLNNKCSNQDISSCMMLKLVTYFNRMLKKSQIDLGDVEITKTSTEITTVESSRSLKDVEKMSDDEQMSQVITDKLYDFIRTRSMKWHVSNQKLYRQVLDKTRV